MKRGELKLVATVQYDFAASREKGDYAPDKSTVDMRIRGPLPLAPVTHGQSAFPSKLVLEAVGVSIAAQVCDFADWLAGRLEKPLDFARTLLENRIEDRHTESFPEAQVGEA